MTKLSIGEARRFLLRHHGLLGESRFHGAHGMMAFVRQAGCVQFDPVDVCGRSPELVFLARVPGYHAGMMENLLYGDRRLVDYFDKNLAILPLEDWPYFRRERERYGAAGRSFEHIVRVREMVLGRIRHEGPLSASQLGMGEKVDWYWSRTTLARAALEQLYFGGELVIHHKTGSVKSYDLAERHIPAELLGAPEPLLDEVDHQCWRVLRRVRAVGMLWGRASDAWLGIPGFKAERRNLVFQRLSEQERILPVTVEGIRGPLYVAREDEETLNEALAAGETDPRCALIAPLDSLIWDRKLIAALFGFRYSWEVYTPKDKRAYGSYVLPVLYGERFIGRVEPVCDRRAGVLRVRGLWWEDGFRPDRQTERALNDALLRLAEFNGCILGKP